jgi:hypothetical protein
MRNVTKGLLVDFANLLKSNLQRRQKWIRNVLCSEVSRQSINRQVACHGRLDWYIQINITCRTYIAANLCDKAGKGPVNILFDRSLEAALVRTTKCNNTFYSQEFKATAKYIWQSATEKIILQLSTRKLTD